MVEAFETHVGEGKDAAEDGAMVRFANGNVRFVGKEMFNTEAGGRVVAYVKRTLLAALLLRPPRVRSRRYSYTTTTPPTLPLHYYYYYY